MNSLGRRRAALQSSALSACLVLRRVIDNDDHDPQINPTGVRLEGRCWQVGTNLITPIK